MKSGKSGKPATLDKQLETRYKKKRTAIENFFESEIKSISLGAVIQDARKFRQLTQQALALKSETTKSYISRIENSASDIRFSTLMKIVHEGLGGKLNFVIEIKNLSFPKKK